MHSVQYLIAGAGITGLSFANWLGSRNYLICEASNAIGGYCKTIVRDGFVWDYAGHFVHFRNREIQEYLFKRMPGPSLRVMTKDARVCYQGQFIPYPFQKNIHELPKQDFIECLYDLFFRERRKVRNLKEALYSQYGRSISEKFMVPYNEKLLTLDLSLLAANALGRFPPSVTPNQVIRNMRHPDDTSYNATFMYPEGGAIQYVLALASALNCERIHIEEPILSIDLKHRVAVTPLQEIHFEYLVSSIPLDQLLKMTSLSHDPSTFTYTKVLVFNLGFDRKGLPGVHWIYFHEKQFCFYRVGFYDNLFNASRMSLYVEIALPSDADTSETSIHRLLQETLRGLEAAGIVQDQELLAEHHVVLNPAYVHIRPGTTQAVNQLKRRLANRGVHSIGRYGSWTYCSIEDCMVEARSLALALA